MRASKRRASAQQARRWKTAATKGPAAAPQDGLQEPPAHDQCSRRQQRDAMIPSLVVTQWVPAAILRLVPRSWRKVTGTPLTNIVMKR